MSKPKDGSNPPKPDPFAKDSEADQQWWDLCMDHVGFNVLFRYTKDDMRAVSIYPNTVDH